MKIVAVNDNMGSDNLNINDATMHPDNDGNKVKILSIDAEAHLNSAVDSFI